MFQCLHCLQNMLTLFAIFCRPYTGGEIMFWFLIIVFAIPVGQLKFYISVPCCFRRRPLQASSVPLGHSRSAWQTCVGLSVINSGQNLWSKSCKCPGAVSQSKDTWTCAESRQRFGLASLFKKEGGTQINILARSVSLFSREMSPNVS